MSDSGRTIEETTKANERQPGGMHYIKYGNLQPWDVTARFGLGFFDGNAVKYLLRWKDKGGVEDLEKAKHYIDKLIELVKDGTIKTNKG
jgi:hypothetical protein